MKKRYKELEKKIFEEDDDFEFKHDKEEEIPIDPVNGIAPIIKRSLNHKQNKQQKQKKMKAAPGDVSSERKKQGMMNIPFNRYDEDDFGPNWVNTEDEHLDDGTPYDSEETRDYI